MDPTNLGDLFRRDFDFNQVALIDLGGESSPREFTFAQLDAMANAVARGLDQLALLPGTRIGILSANRAEFIASYLGIMRAGLVAVPVNYKFPQKMIDFVLADSGAQLVFCDALRAPHIPSTLRKIVFNQKNQKIKTKQKTKNPLKNYKIKNNKKIKKKSQKNKTFLNEKITFLR